MFQLVRYRFRFYNQTRFERSRQRHERNGILKPFLTRPLLLNTLHVLPATREVANPETGPRRLAVDNRALELVDAASFRVP